MLEMLLDKKLLFVLMGMLTGLGVADKCIVSMTMIREILIINARTGGRQVYREYDDETYDRGGGKYEQKQSSVDAPGPGEIRTCMYDQ